jgi:hypothetical protein
MSPQIFRLASGLKEKSMMRFIFMILLISGSRIYAQGPLLPAPNDQILNQIATDYKLVGVILDSSSHDKSIAVIRKVGDASSLQLKEGSKIEQATIHKIARGSVVIKFDQLFKNLSYDTSAPSIPTAEAQAPEVQSAVIDIERPTENPWDESGLEKINIEKIYKISDLSGENSSEDSSKNIQTKDYDYTPEPL